MFNNCLQKIETRIYDTINVLVGNDLICKKGKWLLIHEIYINADMSR